MFSWIYSYINTDDYLMNTLYQFQIFIKTFKIPFCNTKINEIHLKVVADFISAQTKESIHVIIMNTE